MKRCQGPVAGSVGQRLRPQCARGTGRPARRASSARAYQEHHNQHSTGSNAAEVIANMLLRQASTRLERGHDIHCTACHGKGCVLCPDCRGAGRLSKAAHHARYNLAGHAMEKAKAMLGLLGAKKQVNYRDSNRCTRCHGRGVVECAHCHGAGVINPSGVPHRAPGTVHLYRAEVPARRLD